MPKAQLGTMLFKEGAISGAGVAPKVASEEAQLNPCDGISSPGTRASRPYWIRLGFPYRPNIYWEQMNSDGVGQMGCDTRVLLDFDKAA